MSTKSRSGLSLFYFPLVGLVFGICAQTVFSAPTGALVIAILGLTILALFMCTHKRMTQVALALLFAATGALTLELRKTDMAFLHQKYENKTLTLVGTVTSKECADSPFYQEVITVCVDSVTEQGKSCAQKFNIQIYAHQKTTVLPADSVKITNVHIQTQAQQNLSGNPSFVDYLFKENIFTTIFTAGKNIEITLLSRPRVSLSRWFWDIRNNLYKNIKYKLSRTSRYYFSLIFLGNRQLPQQENNALRKTFNYWGLAHYLARAGLHISLFIIIWRCFLRFIPMHILFKRILLLLMCFVYSLFSWPSIPFSRAYFTFLLLQAGALLYRQTNFLHVLSLLTLVILLVNPMQLFFLDFQLSFGLTLAIAWVATL